MSDLGKDTPFEKQMARINNSVITIKNPTKEDFSHTYDGISYTVEAGETLPFPFPVGTHLARHLAMKMSRDAYKARMKVGDSNDKKSVNLYTDAALEKYLSEIIVNKEERPLAPSKSPGQILKEKTDEMQQHFSKEKSPVTVTKKQVIEELRKRKIKFNPRDEIEALLALLTQSEMQGKTGDDDEEDEEEGA